MSDFSFIQKRNPWADMDIVDGDFKQDNFLETAVMISLFSDAPATSDELSLFNATAQNASMNRGWCFNGFASTIYGSKLWLLEKMKKTNSTLDLAKQYCESALAWLVDDGISSGVTVETSWSDANSDVLNIQIDIERQKDQNIIKQYSYVWEPLDKPDEAKKINSIFLNGSSFRKLTDDDTYSGPLVQLITLDRNTVVDFYGTKAVGDDFFIDETAVASAFGSTDAYINKLYDQSGAGNHLLANGGGYVKMYDGSTGLYLNPDNGLPECRFINDDYLWFSEMINGEKINDLAEDLSVGEAIEASDDFEGTELNTDRWNDYTSGSGGTAQILNNKLNIETNITTGQKGVHMTGLVETGDVSVTINVSDYVSGTGVSSWAGVFFNIGGTFRGIDRNTISGIDYFEDLSNTVLTSANTFSLRVRRTGSNTYTEYNEGSGWNTLVSRVESGTITEILIRGIANNVSTPTSFNVDSVEVIDGSGDPIYIGSTPNIPETELIQFSGLGGLECGTSIAEDNQDFTFEIDFEADATSADDMYLFNSKWFSASLEWDSEGGDGDLFVSWGTETSSFAITRAGRKYFSLVYDHDEREISCAINGELELTLDVSDAGDPEFDSDTVYVGCGLSNAEPFTGKVYFARMSLSALYTEYPYVKPDYFQWIDSTAPLFLMNMQSANKQFQTMTDLKQTKRPIGYYAVTRPYAADAGTLADTGEYSGGSTVGDNLSLRQIIWSGDNDKWSLACGELSSVIEGDSIVPDVNKQITAIGNRNSSLIAEDGTIEGTGSTSPANAFFGSLLSLGSSYWQGDTQYSGSIQELLVFAGARDTIIETNQIDTYNI